MIKKEKSTSVMTELEIKEKIDNIGKFKNTEVNFNQEKEICDVYTKVKISHTEFLERMKNIPEITVTYCDFGIFELVFSLDGRDEIVNNFVEEFK